MAAQSGYSGYSGFSGYSGTTPSVAKIGFGMWIGYASTYNGAPTVLADLIEIKPSAIKVGKADATTHGSPNGYTEQTSGLATWEEAECQIDWNRTNVMTLRGLVRTDQYWYVGYPDGSVDAFYGFLVEIGTATPMKERMVSTLKIQPKNVVLEAN